MALSGHVRTLSLSQLFQTLSHGPHTGTLVVRHGAAERRVELDRGVILSVSGTRDERKQLGMLLVQAGHVEMSALLPCLDEQESSGRPLGRILLAHGLVSHETLEATLREQLIGRLFDAFLWDDATYTFTRHAPGERSNSQGIETAVPAAEFLMEAARRLDEWRRLLARFPSEDIILRLAPGREDEVASAIVTRGILFDPELISGAKPMREVFAISGLGQAQTGSLLLELAERGWIAPVPLAEVVGACNAAVERGALDVAMDFLHHARVLGLDTAERRRLEDRLFADRRLARRGVGRPYPIDRQGVELVELVQRLLKQRFLGILEVVCPEETMAITIGHAAIAVTSTRRDLAASILDVMATQGSDRALLRAQLIAEGRRGESWPHALLASAQIEANELQRLIEDSTVDALHDLALAEVSSVTLHAPAAPNAAEHGTLGVHVTIGPLGVSTDLLSLVHAKIQRLRPLANLDRIFTPTTAFADRSKAQPIIRQVDGRTSVRRLLASSSLPRTATAELLLAAIESWKIRPLTTDELFDAIEKLLEADRPGDALAACRGARDEPDAADFVLLAQTIIDVHGDLAQIEPHYRLEAELDELPVADLLQALCLHKMTGTLRVRSGRHSRLVYLERGNPYYLRRPGDPALTSVMRGTPASSTRMRSPTDRFRLHAGLISEDDASDEMVAEVKALFLDTFLWSTGRLEFVANELPPEFRNPANTTLKLRLVGDRFLLAGATILRQHEELVASIPANRSLVTCIDPQRLSEIADPAAAEATRTLIESGATLEQTLERSTLGPAATVALLHSVACAS